LPTIDAPTLVVTGQLDRVLIPEASVFIDRALPASTLVTLQPAGHMGLIEQHARLNEVVERFCATCFRGAVAAVRR
jgi:pimeloyl-ACP methyl ester carboxylesterase